MFRRIQWRIAIPYVLLILVSMAILSFFLANFIESEKIKDLKAQLEDDALLVAESSLSLWDVTDTEAINKLANQLSDTIDARVTIIDAEGTVWGDSASDPQTMENHAGRPEIQQALEKGTGESRRKSMTLRQTMMYVAVPVVLDGETVGAARVALPTDEVNSSVNTLQRTIWLAMGITTLFAILVALYIARITTRPIQEVTKAAKRIANGELDQTIYATTNDESASLATAFNEMAQSLRKTIGDLSTERNKLAAVLDTMVDGVVMTDINGIVVMANPAAREMFRFNSQKATGSRLREIIPDAEVDTLFQRYLKTGKEQSGQIEQHTRGKLLRAIVSPVSYHDSVGALLIFQDLTEVRRLQSVRQQFVGNISHELRTPLASIKAVVETLAEGAINKPETAVSFLGRIDQEIDRMTQMIRELTELSRIETGQIELRLAPIDLTEVIDRAIAELELQADRKGISIQKDIQGKLPLVRAEAERIMQVLLNLLHNATKFSPPSSQVTISAKPEGGSVVVSIRDNGTGILPDDLPHVFERFYKADKARSSEGTGLGLAIAKHLVQIHGGEIWAESEPEKGATISFRLPKA